MANNRKNTTNVDPKVDMPKPKVASTGFSELASREAGRDTIDTTLPDYDGDDSTSYAGSSLEALRRVGNLELNVSTQTIGRGPRVVVLHNSVRGHKKGTCIHLSTLVGDQIFDNEIALANEINRLLGLGAIREATPVEAGHDYIDINTRTEDPAYRQEVERRVSAEQEAEHWRKKYEEVVSQSEDKKAGPSLASLAAPQQTTTSGEQTSDIDDDLEKAFA